MTNITENDTDEFQSKWQISDEAMIYDKHGFSVTLGQADAKRETFHTTQHIDLTPETSDTTIMQLTKLDPPIKSSYINN